MSVPEEIRVRLSRWCTERIHDDERAHRQIGYTIQGDEVTIVDRRAPSYPELGGAWNSTPLALLRGHDPDPCRWSLYRAVGDGSWEREGGPADDPLILLERVAR